MLGSTSYRDACSAAEKSAEVSRLSAKTLELMAAVQAGNDQRKRLEAKLDVATKEKANLANQLANAQRERGSRPATPKAAAAPRRPSASRAPAPSPTTTTSVKILQAALEEADAVTALRVEELHATRAMLQHREDNKLPRVGRPAASSAPPASPGKVARLQAELMEAA